MRVAILTNSRPNYSLVLAQGLGQMLAQVGLQYRLFYNGLEMLYRPLFGPWNARSSYRNLFSQLRFYLQLHRYSAIVVVMTIPEAFFRSFQVERLRRFLPHRPIVQYANMFAGNSGGGVWLQRLREGIPSHSHPDLRRGHNPGLERYDWYLCTSVSSTTPLPHNAPVSVIGANLDDGTLYPEQDEFMALVDFERPDYMRDRALQIQALEATHTRYVVLNGEYTLSDIRQLYRKSCIYFLACPESFGLPICELQACGSYVFTPYADWVAGHWIKDASLPGPGVLTSNFVVYGSDPQNLIGAIDQIKRSYDPNRVVSTFLTMQPQLIKGNTAELRDFLRRVAAGVINSRTHESFI